MELVAQSLGWMYAENERLRVQLSDLVTRWMRVEHANRLRIFGLEPTTEGGWVLLTEPEPPYSLASIAKAAAGVPLAERIGWAAARVVEAADALTSFGELHGELEAQNVAFERNRLVLFPPTPRAMEREMVTGQAQIKRDIRWLSPEVVRGEMRVAETDVYGLAYIARVLFGAPWPYEWASELEALEAKMKDEPLPRLRELDSAFPEAIDDAVARATAREPAQRFASVADFAAALRPFVRDGDVLASKLKEQGARRRRLPFLQGVVHRPCSKSWDAMRATQRDDVRHCSDCDLTVQRVKTMAALVPLNGSCVFYDPDEG